MVSGGLDLLDNVSIGGFASQSSASERVSFAFFWGALWPDSMKIVGGETMIMSSKI